jgi:thioredoxin reductase
VAGIKRLKATQDRIREAEHLVVAGGGAAGVELATDAKSYYPNKSVTLVHSRQTLMNRFGPELQKSVMDTVEKLGIRVVLGEKVQAQSADGKFVTLSSGNKLECDCLVRDLDLLAETMADSSDKLHRAKTCFGLGGRDRSSCALTVGPDQGQAYPSDR